MVSGLIGDTGKAAAKAAKKAEQAAKKQRGKDLTESQREQALGERVLSQRSADKGRSLLRFRDTLGKAA